MFLKRCPSELLPERGICMDRMPKKFLEFFNRLSITRWISITLDPWEAYEHQLRDFYVNHIVFSLSNPIMMFRGQEVHFGVAQVKKVYMVPDADMDDFKAKGFEPGTQMASILYLTKRFSEMPPKEASLCATSYQRPEFGLTSYTVELCLVLILLLSLICILA